MMGLGTAELVILCAIGAGFLVLLVSGVVIFFVLWRRHRRGREEDWRDSGQEDTYEEVTPIALGDDDRPWERRGAIRRDCEPHRGNLIQILGITSIVMASIALPSCFCSCAVLPLAILAMTLGITVWVMGSKDLRKMDDGVLDPRGRKQTRLGKNLGIAATIAGAVAVLLFVTFVVVILAMQMAQNPNFF